MSNEGGKQNSRHKYLATEQHKAQIDKVAFSDDRQFVNSEQLGEQKYREAPIELSDKGCVPVPKSGYRVKSTEHQVRCAQPALQSRPLVCHQICIPERSFEVTCCPSCTTNIESQPVACTLKSVANVCNPISGYYQLLPVTSN
ncbi:hypothetical protein O9929_12310 [Vibrio lentus]|nr:hypothetical protein [Vibrio lentus]